MDWKTAILVFGTVFVAELGDKTQLATLLYAADGEVSKWSVFIGAALALVLASAIGVLAGGWMSAHIGQRTLALGAGVGFIAIGVWTLWRAI